jgi:hypothetical protein
MSFSDSMYNDRRSEVHGDHFATTARYPESFIDQQIQPLLYERTEPTNSGYAYTAVTTEKEFWLGSAQERTGRQGRELRLPDVVTLVDFTITDWFPRAPGVFWTANAAMARENVYSTKQEHDPLLGGYYRPESKMSLIEYGGLGTIRLRPRKIEGEYCWLATALTGRYCHTGVPLAIPARLLERSHADWGDVATITGHVRFLQDAGLNAISDNMTGTRPLILFVEDIRDITARQSDRHLLISPVVLFQPDTEQNPEREYWSNECQYTFAQCEPHSDSELDSVIQWMQRYTEKFTGRIITNFDEQRPQLADAPLSYQRLVRQTYDRQIINQFGGTIIAERIQISTYLDHSTHSHGGVHVGDNITAGDNAIINNRSVLNNVTQTIGASSNLTLQQKADLELLINKLSDELSAIRIAHPAETAEIADAVEKVVAVASKPEKTKPFLDLKASNLIDAAKLAAEFAPTVMHAAEKLATYIQGLV